MVKVLVRLITRSALAAIIAIGVLSLAAQTYRTPRGPDGKPDLNGIWQTLNEANFDLQGHMARPAMALRPGPYGAVPAPPVLALGAVGAVPPGLGVVEGGEIPYKPEALAIKKQNQQDWLERDPEIKCYLPGVPRATYMPYPFQILQSAKALTFVYEYDGAVRNIYLKNPGPAPADSWMGQSVARWEGETLVIDVTGFDERTWLDRAGDFHSDALHVVERYTMIEPDVLNYEATIEDPKVFSKPWKIRMPLYRHVEKGARLLEFKCVEFVEDLLYGDFAKKPK